MENVSFDVVQNADIENPVGTETIAESNAVGEVSSVSKTLADTLVVGRVVFIVLTVICLILSIIKIKSNGFKKSLVYVIVFTVVLVLTIFLCNFYVGTAVRPLF